MNFCDLCGAKMTRTPTPDGRVVFVCACLNQIDGTPADTRFECIYYGDAAKKSVEMKHKDLIFNAPFDHAANIVMKDCPDCGLDFVTLLRIGSAETTMYTCSCGWKSNNIA